MKMSGTTLKISKPLFGYLLILALVGLSSVLSAYYYCGYSIAQWGTWEPEKKHRTCRMILVMTIFYVIVITPAGISEYVVLFVTIQPFSILELLVGYGSIFISALFCLNASLHGIINFTMSSKYRKTVRKCFGMEKQRQGSMVLVSTVFERASYWLGVSLAFTRLVIMKISGTTLEISKPLFGYLLILALVGLSSVLSAYYYCGYSIAQWDTWEPEKKCTGYPANYSEPTYYRNFADNENLFKISRRYQMINGVSRANLNFVDSRKLTFFRFLSVFLIQFQQYC
ncbi:hypothetical protein L5515_006421 [Caenorhabditis briggsae]|uniref:Uncharacterized protein n=1 Tax=Caenorhabditis briggsae TaxID=6238 RepID=A0AAE9JKY1_CAEBR|nr:hypothetical protein L5515_006421 [Caenorhabditis briggsae]